IRMLDLRAPPGDGRPTMPTQSSPSEAKRTSSAGKTGSTKRTMRKDFERSKTVPPTGITGKERPTDILAHNFPAYVGRQERTAFELMQRSSREDTCTFLTFSGAMTPAGLHQSCLIPLLE